MRYNALRPLQRTATRSDTGDAAGALKAYKRCIEIDPANSAAKGELQRLELDQVIFLGVTATRCNALLLCIHVCVGSHTHTSHCNTLQRGTATQP